MSNFARLTVEHMAAVATPATGHLCTPQTSREGALLAGRHFQQKPDADADAASHSDTFPSFD
jgi:hypothetical protein